VWLSKIVIFDPIHHRNRLQMNAKSRSSTLSMRRTMIKLICRRRKPSNLELSVSHSTIIVDRFVLFQGYIRSWNLSPNSHARVGQIPEFGNNLHVYYTAIPSRVLSAILFGFPIQVLICGCGCNDRRFAQLAAPFVFISHTDS